LIPVFGIGTNKSAVRNKTSIESEIPPCGCQGAGRRAQARDGGWQIMDGR
jgi:hypothetical protein